MSKEPFMKIERDEPLSHRVEKQIREAIKKKIFVPGDKLPGELALVEKFGVSRTAIREALRMLVGRGLITIEKGRGIFVSEMDPSYVVDPLYQLINIKAGKAGHLHLVRVRLFMEPNIARSAAENRDKEDAKFLRENFQKMKAMANEPTKMVDFDIEFHRRISQATNNPIIPVIMEPIFQLLPKFISDTYKKSHAPDLALEYHELLVKYITEQNPQQAFKVMHNHMSQAEEHVLQHYKSIGFPIESLSNDNSDN